MTKRDFGSSRENRLKLYFHETERELLGLHSPGPIYNLKQINVSAQSYSIAKQLRNKTQPKYNYYSIASPLFTIPADQQRRPKPPVVRFGRSNRFPSPQSSDIPFYEVRLPDNSVKVSFGQKNDLLQQALKLGTPSLVGPGRYQSVPRTPRQAYTFPKAPRTVRSRSVLPRLHETQFAVNSIGPQVESRRSNSPKFSTGQSTREDTYYIMKQDLARVPINLKIVHPTL